MVGSVPLGVGQRHEPGRPLEAGARHRVNDGAPRRGSRAWPRRKGSGWRPWARLGQVGGRVTKPAVARGTDQGRAPISEWWSVLGRTRRRQPRTYGQGGDRGPLTLTGE